MTEYANTGHDTHTLKAKCKISNIRWGTQGQNLEKAVQSLI